MSSVTSAHVSPMFGLFIKDHTQEGQLRLTSHQLLDALQHAFNEGVSSGMEEAAKQILSSVASRRQKLPMTEIPKMSDPAIVDATSIDIAPKSLAERARDAAQRVPEIKVPTTTPTPVITQIARPPKPQAPQQSQQSQQQRRPPQQRPPQPSPAQQHQAPPQQPVSAPPASTAPPIQSGPVVEVEYDDLVGEGDEDFGYTFEKAGLNAGLVKALTTMGMEKAHREQFRAVKVLEHHADHDLIVNAPTGSGKTLIGVISCMLPIIQDLERIKDECANPKQQVRNYPSVRSIYMTPVSCTVPQIVEQFLVFTQSLGIPDAAIHAINPAQDIRHELSACAHAKVLIGTPHQLMKLINPTAKGVSTINASGAKISVVDEVDWIHLQHSHDGHLSQSDAMYRLFGKFSRDIRMVLMGATMTEDVMDLVKKYLRPKFVTLKNECKTVLGHIQHFKVEIDEAAHKPAVLADLVPKLRSGGIVFASNPTAAHEILIAAGMRADRIGVIGKDTPKEEVKRIGQNFRKRLYDVFICDDSHCRGFDASHVYWVYNHDLPTGDAWWDTMIHRLGRCGRHLSTGKSITILTQDDKDRFDKFVENIGVNFNSLPDLSEYKF